MNVVGGGVPDAPRRGQDPSLRCKRHMGGNGKVAGRACPAPTDCCEWVANGRGEGGRQPAPLQLASGCPFTGGNARPVGIPQAANAASPFDKGAFLFPLRGFGGTPEFKVEEGSAALRTDSNTASV